jgi:hypothetical protein
VLGCDAAFESEEMGAGVPRVKMIAFADSAYDSNGTTVEKGVFPVLYVGLGP